MILSDTIPPIEELTGNLAYGEVVKAADVESLKEALIRETERNTAEQEAEEIATYAREQRASNSAMYPAIFCTRTRAAASFSLNST